jgi:prepilin-type N-terminal cleavage/methylation domain-containing protein
MKKPQNDGFTITELAISLTVASILALVLFTATFYYYVNTAQTETSTNLALESQNVLTQLTDDIRLSDSIASTNAISDPNGPSGGWITNDPSNIIIIESPAIDSSRNLIYNPTTGFPYRNEYIYFLSGTNMYKLKTVYSAIMCLTYLLHSMTPQMQPLPMPLKPALFYLI